MRKPKPFYRVLTEGGPLTVLAVAIALLVGIAGPASAQFFNFGGWSRPAPPRPGGGGGGWFGGDFFSPFQQQQPKRVQDFSRAPPPDKRDPNFVPERHVLVLGDGMADWLAYGLEDAYHERPEMAVIRKNRATSGLIRYQPRGEPSDWAAAAKQVLATEKPDAIVVMLGINDRVAMRETATEKADKPADRNKKDARAKDAKQAAKPDAAAKPDTAKPDAAAKPDDKPADDEADNADNADTPPIVAPEKTVRSGSGLYEFRDERWIELYAKKIEELIAVLKTKGVPVLWVGLPAMRGPKGTADMLFLDSLYRDGAGKAGITYVDVWDGFVDEAGRFLQKGPDFEGQIRQLRSYDGVYFTKPGARKLAHYVDREITRLLAGRSGPIALPSEPATPDINAVPGQPAPRPMAGPIVPLVAASINNDQLLGGPGSRPAPVDNLAARTLVKGEALAPPAGRADDFAWPRREVGREQAKGDSPVASVAPDGTVVQPGPRPPPVQQQQQRPPQHQPAQPGFGQPPAGHPGSVQPGQIQQQRPPPRPAQNPTPSLRDLFGFGNSAPAPRQVAPPPGGPRPPVNNGVPRPPANVGRSAAVPPSNATR
ncbi:DUF459 domain-containing protein [Bradyrhizobium sp.]|uniref:DUF459 domain-containing protein n=1 Tax=Bradyrhizobium sp. TaxID=376 RepID=UPI0040379AC8